MPFFSVLIDSLLDMHKTQQKQKFEKNWRQNQKKFGSQDWSQHPDFLFLVEIPLPEKVTNVLRKDQENLLKGLKFGQKIDTFHITLALPGRLGTHFQKNDIPFMKKKLLEIVSDYSSFQLQISNINCFPTVIFREVYDETQTLQKLHEEICSAIPFSQNPEYQFEHFLPHVSLVYGGKECENILMAPDFDLQRPDLSFWVDKI